MKQAVILSHPSARSFNAAIADAYVQEVRRLGHDVILRDLYEIDFDPRLRARELPWETGSAPGPDVAFEVEQIENAEVFVLVYPLWFNAPPAILKGYVERVFGIGLGYGGAGGKGSSRLRGRGLVSFTTSGAPEAWAEQSGALPGLRHAFDDYLAQVCDMTVLAHQHFGGVVPTLRPDAAGTMLEEVRATAARLFAPSAELHRRIP